MKLDTQFPSYFAEVNLLGKKDFHDVVRESLNSAALSTKRKYIPRLASEKFTVRRKNFFTALTAVNYAKRGQSKDLNGLFSEVGFIKNRSTENMAIQEWGGSIKREVKPLNASRVGRSYNRAVSRTNMFNKGLMKQSQQAGKTARQRFAILINNARKQGANFVEADEYDTIYKLTAKTAVAVYASDKSNTETLEGRHLLRDASDEARGNIETTFVTEANKKIKYRASKVKW